MQIGQVGRINPSGNALRRCLLAPVCHNDLRAGTEMGRGRGRRAAGKRRVNMTAAWARLGGVRRQEAAGKAEEGWRLQRTLSAGSCAAAVGRAAAAAAAPWPSAPFAPSALCASAFLCTASSVAASEAVECFAPRAWAARRAAREAAASAAGGGRERRAAEGGKARLRRQASTQTRKHANTQTRRQARV